ncbi:MAG: hypothetical protein ACD_49C00086G0004 [uncultured bacterium (gcode 4)]|uniref:Uncharacterized protein n=1 Tax=uncultured bacterium (gcode 4) TaxID=1234023 RepID=K2BAM3_9BACT|nr:MAG: hypothetical protein ACD_49C00086G0004 [uncultured bacterium (gcode 4)]
MPKLTPLKYQQVINKLQKLWFSWPIYWGRHAHMKKWSKIIPIPIHWWKQIWVWLISMVIKEIWITRDEWIKL